METQVKVHYLLDKTYSYRFFRTETSGGRGENPQVKFGVFSVWVVVLRGGGRLRVGGRLLRVGFGKPNTSSSRKTPSVPILTPREEGDLYVSNSFRNRFLNVYFL